MLQFPVLFPTSIIYYFCLHSIALFPTQGQLKRYYGGCVIFKGLASFVAVAILSIVVWDFLIFSTYENTSVSDVFSLIFKRTIDEPETRFLVKCVWISWTWSFLQLLESCFQFAWWIKLLKYSDYQRDEQESPGDASEDGMTYSTNQLHSQNDLRTPRNDDLFDDSDSEEIVETALSKN